MTATRALLSTLLFLFIATPTIADGSVYWASDQSFSVKLPSNFGPEPNSPSNAVLAAEIPNSGFNFACVKSEAVELEGKVFAEKMKRNLYDGGAQIYAKSKGKLGDQPAASFLVGGIKEGKESLFVFNQRPDAVYTFILNYPKGQRSKATQMWNQMQSSFKFKDIPKKKKKK